MKNINAEVALKIANLFAFGSEAVSCKPFGNGHINHTFLVETSNGKDYILQQVNKGVFPHPDQVMHNVALVTEYLRKDIRARGGDPERETLTIVKTNDGKNYYTDEDGDLWRAYLRIRNTISYQLPENEDVFREAGRAFGSFQTALKDFPADRLYETIPHFHDTPMRYQAFEKAVSKDAYGRCGTAANEISFVEERSVRAAELVDAMKNGKLPLRVTHNDTKLDNVLIDAATHKGLCVIDLDTIMPGLTAYDFGDALRFGANTAVEDEKDLSKIHFSMLMYKAWTQGFMEAAGSGMTQEEILSLPVGAWMMTYECGLRFLMDYLEGDHYFHIAYAEHNLVRAKDQFALLKDMEAHEAEMIEYIRQWIRSDAQ